MFVHWRKNSEKSFRYSAVVRGSRVNIYSSEVILQQRWVG